MYSPLLFFFKSRLSESEKPTTVAIQCYEMKRTKQERIVVFTKNAGVVRLVGRVRK